VAFGGVEGVAFVSSKLGSVFGSNGATDLGELETKTPSLRSLASFVAYSYKLSSSFRDQNLFAQSAENPNCVIQPHGVLHIAAELYAARFNRSRERDAIEVHSTDGFVCAVPTHLLTRLFLHHIKSIAQPYTIVNN